MKKFNNKKQDGFSILAVILVIVAVIVAIGVWALSGQTNTNNTGSSTSDIQATSILNDANAIKLAFDNLVIGGSTASSIVFVPNTASTGTAPNILDPTNGIQVPKVNSNVIKVSPSSFDGYWIYNPTGFYVPYPGTSYTAPTILLTGVKQSVCQRINYSLYGSTYIPQYGAINASFDFVTGATSTAPTSTRALDFKAWDNAVYNWKVGCVKPNWGPDENVVFRILK